MKKYWYSLILSVVLLSCSVEQLPDYSQYVNPLIGNADNGHTFPGACVPFGLIQVSPESGTGEWRYCSGFNYDDDFIDGFTQTHLNGTGVPDLGDILMLPFCGELQGGVYKSRYNKKTQKASAGYYYVDLTDANVDVELTATPHTAFHKYTFKGSNPRILLDLQRGLVSCMERLRAHVLTANVSMPDPYTIIGNAEVTEWVQRQYFYVIKFDKPYAVEKELPMQEGEKGKRFILSFDGDKDDIIQIKIGISSVSIDGAIASLEKENPNWSFEKTKQNAKNQWNELLSRAQVSGTEEEKINFYTSMYHLFTQPNNIADIDGKYRGADDKVYTSPTGVYYSTFSLWDTYRAAHPLYTILAPEKVDGMVQTMIDHYKVQGALPIWSLWGRENYCMIGNHAIPVILDAYLKGFKGFNTEDAYKAIKGSSMVSHRNSDWEVYNKYGYYPYDITAVESVSRTLESCYDDYCVAQMAKALGRIDDYEYFNTRAGFYKNLLDPQTNLMRGKDSKGNWRTPFNPRSSNHRSDDYCEGTAWQWTWFVPHDVEGLVNLMGGEDAFVQKLDSLFSADSSLEGETTSSDISGLIGQYAHGNEPSHHVIHLYNYVNRPWRTQELVDSVYRSQYANSIDGLSGNEDCGQMSAWYILNSMGFYQVCPGKPVYSIGRPAFDKAVINLPEEKTFSIVVKNNGKKNKYIESVLLNGKALNIPFFNHQDIANGGTMEIKMTDHPTKWGVLSPALSSKKEE